MLLVRLELPHRARKLWICPLHRRAGASLDPPLEKRHLHQEEDQRSQIAPVLDAAEQAEHDERRDEPQKDPEREEERDDVGDHGADGSAATPSRTLTRPSRSSAVTASRSSGCPPASTVRRAS